MSKDTYQPRTYSKLYHPPEENSGDKPRIRRRMSKAFQKAAEEDGWRIGNLIEDEIGIDAPPVRGGYGGSYVNWPRYLESLEWRDFLSTFSILINFLAEQNSYASREKIKTLGQTLRRIFAEENSRLSLGKDGIIHPKIDLAFEHARATLVRGTLGSDYEAVNNHLDAVDKALLADPPDGASAIRSVFLAAENVFKQMSASGAIRLGTREAERDLRPLIEKIYDAGTHERNVARHQLKGFCSWVTAAHNYRHEEGKPEPSQPPEEMYVCMVSEGFAWVRWLVDLRKLSES